ncbi:MAG: glycoside hydrolase family 2 TIM barrel-domain containing protein [Suilimivivens sp.]
MAAERLWNEGWEFCRQQFCEDNLQIPENAVFKRVDIPHDFMIYDTHNLYRTGIGWYRKDLKLKDSRPEDEYVLRFDGVYMDATVFVNGNPAGEWKYGYSAFEVEITPFLQEGENQIHVRVIYQEPNTRWYSGAGIYRNVWLKQRNRNHILSDGIYLTPVKHADGSWKVETDTEIYLHCIEGQKYCLKQILMDKRGKFLAGGESLIQAGREGIFTVSQSLGPVTDPELWDIGKGNLYRVKTELYREKELLETQEENIGFRVMEFFPDKGFWLNGRKVKLNGVCEHHDFGALGAAFYKEAARRKLKLLRKMGVNAVRTSHNMPAKEFMELADEMGILVVSEAFDMWERPKTAYDYARFFHDWYERDVESWVRRDRNHASLLMWSIGNEIQDTLEENRGPQLTENLINEVRKYDYKNHAPVTFGSNFMKWEHPQKCAEMLDCVGYNYSEYLYEEHHKKYGNWVIYGSETASVLASRGIYHFPLSKSILTDEDEQCSALGNSVTGWGAAGYENCIGDDRDADFSMGQFIWTGFDYIGESTPYDTKNSYYGQLDTAGFPKDSYYIFQSEWTDYRENPMVHLFPYWDFNEGQLIDVQAATNGSSVELFVNGRSCGKHLIDHTKGRQQLGIWQIPYEKGEITAVAYDPQGKEIARETRHSFAEAVSIRALPDKYNLRADGLDLIFMEIVVLDGNGYPVENAKNRIHVEVQGAGRLIGLDNGDSTDFDAFKGKSKRLFSGKLLAVIGSTFKTGAITVTLTSPGLPDCVVSLQAVASPFREGVSAIEENREYPLYGGGSEGKKLTEGETEIPVRKIEFEQPFCKVLTKENPETEIRVRVCPYNATYQEVEWRAVNDTGISVNYVELTPKEKGVRVKALGDGAFRLKCFARNGGSAVSVQSVMEMKAEGIGRAYFDPYKEIPAGLCDFKSEKAGTGIKHGINFLGSEKGKKECIIGFNSIDFGSEGTEEIVLPVFANTNDPVTFEIWRGKPFEKGSALLADCFYHKPPQWMVFQEQSYLLKEVLKRNEPLYIATDCSFQLRGIYFKRKNRAYSRNYAGECDSIYGDSYERVEKRVEKIGNNVSLVFEHMDFGKEGAGRITLSFRSHQDLNPVQIRFVSNQENSIQVVEAGRQEEYGEMTFEIERLKGKGDVSFIFLPGSCFDFDWFQFEN